MQEFLAHSAGMLERLPDRIAAPLLGQVYRAVLGHNPWVLALVGPPGSYKTSVAAKAMHHFGEQWEHSKPASSMSGNGDTLNTLRFKLHNAKDCLYWADDFAPTRSWTEAQKHLEETARLVHNQEERGRTARDGLSISEGTPPRASGLFTSEVMPRPGSGAERMLVVPICGTDVCTGRAVPVGPAPLPARARAGAGQLHPAGWPLIWPIGGPATSPRPSGTPSRWPRRGRACGLRRPCPRCGSDGWR